MLLFSLTDNSIRILGLSQTFFIDYLSFAAEKEATGLIQKGEIFYLNKMVAALRHILDDLKLKDRKCAFTIHDERAYTLRLHLPQTKDGETVSEAIEKQASLFIPEPLETLQVAFRAVDPNKEQGEVQLIAVDRKVLDRYLSVFESLNLRPVLAVPESYAIFALLSPLLKEGETIIYLNPEVSVDNAIVLDKKGIIATFSEQDLEKVREFALEKWGRKIQRVFGPTSMGDVLRSYPLHLRFKPEQIEIGRFASLFGLALLAQRKDSLNLLSS